jgi:hypothetical protein
VNAQRTEEEIFADLDKFFKDRTPEHSGLQTTVALHWQDIDRWLSSVPADVLTTVCAGEEQDAAEAMVGAPRGTDTLLNELFEKVC